MILSILQGAQDGYSLLFSQQLWESDWSKVTQVSCVFESQFQVTYLQSHSNHSTTLAWNIMVKKLSYESAGPMFRSHPFAVNSLR